VVWPRCRGGFSRLGWAPVDRSALIAQVLDAAPDAIVGVAMDGRIVIANRHVERLFGYTRSELVGSQVEVMVPARRQAKHRLHRATYFAAPRVRLMGAHGGDLVAVRKDGSEFHCEISLSVVDTPAGQVAVAAIRDVTARTTAEAALQVSERLRRLALDRMVRAQDEERTKIAADLHDDTIQAMTAALLQIDTALRTMRQSRSKRTVAAARQTLAEAVERTRKLTFDLRPQLLDGEGLAAAVAQEAREAAVTAGLELSLDVDVGRYEDFVESIVYRTFHEALANVKKHANARRLEVRLHDDGTVITGHVSDDGVGFDVPSTATRARASHHLGADISAERIRATGGTYNVTSQPGSGTHIEFTLPTTPTPKPHAPTHP
jgi:PAS domain S-box-containing protein